uniref:RRM domain-containing protein n=1 Tax=Oryza brachyantha TaxID=4533 RepID=J3LEX7_ORYBR
MSAQSISPAAPSYFPVPFHLQNVVQLAWPAAPAYNAVYPLPQVQVPQMWEFVPIFHYYGCVLLVMKDEIIFDFMVQQLFQKDAQIITPEALATVKAAIANSEKDKKIEEKKNAVPRKAAGQSWEDPTLADWPENDFRLFCGDLGNEVNDDVLTKAFSKYPSFNMARVIRDKWTGKTKGYGFVSFANASDLAAALKEMNGKYVGNRPIKLRKSTWKTRIDYEALQKPKTPPQKKFKAQKRGVLHK